MNAINEQDTRKALTQQTEAGFARAAQLRRQARERFPQGRAWARSEQRDKLALLHAGDLAAPRTAAAARFFLSDIYPAQTQPWRDALAPRAVATLGKFLPMEALAALAAAADLDAATEEADWPTAAAWPGSSWEEAYKAAGLPARERQIDALLVAGERLGAMAGNKLARPALVAMRLPAKLAGLGALQNFLERGYAAFESLADPKAFAEGLAERERQWARTLFNAPSQPPAPPPP
jgi:hypothetical protein